MRRLNDMKNRRYLSLLSIMLLWMWCSMVQAKLLSILIDGGKVGGIPIAVVPFAVEGADKGSVLDFAHVIHADLHSSGQFSPLSAEQIHQFPNQRAQVQY